MKNLFTLVALGTITLLSTNIYAQCPGGNCGYPQNYDSQGYGGNYGGNQYQNQPNYQQRDYQNYQQGYQQGYQRNDQNYQQPQQQGYQRNDQNYQQQNRPNVNPQTNNNYNYQKSDEQRRNDQRNIDQNLNSDQAISKKVHDVLTGGWLSKGYQNVSYDVNNGTVTLRGNVESQDNKDSIDASIKKLEGVKQVNNEISIVKPTTTTAPAATTTTNPKNYSDSQLQDSERKYPRDTAANPQDRQLNARIRDKLSLGWFSKGSETIVLRTQNGIVIITGSVEKPEDIQKVSDQVKAVDGVSTINNQLQVKPR